METKTISDLPEEEMFFGEKLGYDLNSSVYYVFIVFIMVIVSSFLYPIAFG